MSRSVHVDRRRARSPSAARRAGARRARERAAAGTTSAGVVPEHEQRGDEHDRAAGRSARARHRSRRAAGSRAGTRPCRRGPRCRRSSRSRRRGPPEKRFQGRSPASRKIGKFGISILQDHLEDDVEDHEVQRRVEQRPEEAERAVLVLDLQLLAGEVHQELAVGPDDRRAAGAGRVGTRRPGAATRSRLRWSRARWASWSLSGWTRSGQAASCTGARRARVYAGDPGKTGSATLVGARSDQARIRRRSRSPCPRSGRSTG